MSEQPADSSSATLRWILGLSLPALATLLYLFGQEIWARTSDLSDRIDRVDQRQASGNDELRAEMVMQLEQMRSDIMAVIESASADRDERMSRIEQRDDQARGSIASRMDGIDRELNQIRVTATKLISDVNAEAVGLRERLDILEAALRLRAQIEEQGP